MASVRVQIRIDMSSWNDFLSRVIPQIDAMADDKRDAFISEWEVLKRHGAQEADCGMDYGTTVRGYPSHDFKEHLRRFGVVV